MKNNVIWIMVDAIRNYHSVGDELARLPVMDRLAEEGIYFNNAITSATSTAMSISSQHVGIPSAYLSRTFDDFKYEPENFTTISNIFKNNGYNNYGLSFAIDLRYFYHGIIDHVPKLYWPKGYRDGVAWNNDGLIKLFSNVLENGLKEPFFLFIHINGRRDLDVNQKIENMLKALNNYTKDSIMIMNSDHGMPDPSKKDFFELTRKKGRFKNRHDLLMTDDNILVPLTLKYPGCKKATINVAVGTIDIVPTMLDLLDIEINPDWGIVGKSLVPLLENGETNSFTNRKIRTDTRYLTQNDRITSLRDSRYKYLFCKDFDIDNQEYFYDLLKDSKESTNLIESNNNEYKNIIQEFRQEYNKQEENLLNFQKKYLKRKFNKELNKRIKSLPTIKKIVVFGRGNYQFNYIQYQIIKEILNSANLKYFIDLDRSDGEFISQKQKTFKCYRESDNNFFKKFKLNTKDIDISFITLTTKTQKDYHNVIKLNKQIKPRYTFFLDNNLVFSENLKIENIKRNINSLLVKRDIYLSDPSKLFDDVKKKLKLTPPIKSSKATKIFKNEKQ